MKKITVILVTIMTMLYVIPMKVSAEELSTDFTDSDGDGVYESTSAISAGRYGNFAAGDITYEYTEGSNEERTWSFYLTVGSNNFDYVYMLITPTNVSIDSVTTDTSSFLALNSIPETGGTLLYEVAGDLEAGDRVLLYQIITTNTSDENCQISVSPAELNCSVNIPGIYFDNDGNVITEEEYQEVCGNTTPDNPDDIPSSPETGSVVPYVAIGGGLLAIVVVYLFSRKSNKVYKI